MSKLMIEKNIKLFHIDDGENYYILAADEAEAIGYFEREFMEFDASEYDIKEIPQDDREVYIDVSEDDLLVKVVNYYKFYKEEKNLLIWDYVKWEILTHELRKEEYQIPQLIAGNSY